MTGNNILKTVSIVVLIAFIITSCAPLPPPGTALTDEQRREAQQSCISRYTAVGALGGALVGAVLGGRGGRGVGAVVGAVAGGALAFTLAYGHCMSLFSDLKSYPVAGAQETAQRIGYKPSQGNVMKIEEFYLNPEGISPGGKLEMGGSYYVMAPEGTKEIKVVETRTLEFYDASSNEWKMLGDKPLANEVTAELGTRRADGFIELPDKVAEGNYRITFKISGGGIEDSQTRTLTVKKGLAMGPTQQRPSQIQVASLPGGKAIEPAQKRQVAVIKPITLAIRNEPSVKSEQVATAKQFDMFDVVETKKSGGEFWHKLDLKNGRYGWVQDKNVNIKEH
ncbi:MAG: SH3 domain-containing protein [Thermodesulfovibrionales bacterium]